MNIPTLVVHGGPTREHLTGFTYWWLKYVTGFDPRQHCAKGLIGKYSTRVSKAMPTDIVISLNEHGADALYLCGVATKGYAANFHCPFVHDPASRIVKATWNGFTIVIEGARELPIKPLRAGWHHLDRAFTTCRNYQWGVGFYGAEGTR